MPYRAYNRNKLKIKRERNNDRQKRIYKERLCDTITFSCDYCNEEHTIREIQYNKNKEKNNRYICHKESSVISGKKSKGYLIKVEFIATETEKKCRKCLVIKPLVEFSPDSSATDGYCRMCKVCRREKANAAYQKKKIDIRKNS